MGTRLVTTAALTACTVGFALGRVTAGGEGLRDSETSLGAVPEAGPATDPGASTPLEASAGLSASLTSRSQPSSVAIDATPAKATDGDAAADERPIVRVCVRPVGGLPADWKATAYLLVAGAGGAHRETEIPHATVTGDGEARLIAPVAGTYDVGVVADGVQRLVEDVRVPPGGAEVAVPLPPLAPVRFRLLDPLPPDEPSVDVTGFVHLEHGGDVSTWSDFPGRGEHRHSGPLVMLKDRGTAELVSEAVSTEDPFDLDLDLREEHRTENRTSFDVSDRWELAADSRTARGGDVVSLHLRAVGTGTRAPEQSSVAEAASEERTQEEPPPPPCLDLESPPLAKDEEWAAFGRCSDGEEFFLRGSGPESRRIHGGARGRRGAFVVRPDRVCEEACLPVRGAWTPRLVRGGFVLFAPERAIDPASGAVSVRRADGFPIPHVDRSPFRSPALEAPAEIELEAGGTIGPFAPGPLRLEVRLGRVLLGTVDLEVTAGGLAHLDLPRPAPGTR